MNSLPGTEGSRGHRQSGSGADQDVVYVVPERALVGREDQVSLLDLWLAIWHRKWLGVAIVAVCAMASVVYALTATEWYRAEVLLAPAEERSTQGLQGQLGGLGGLATLAGITVGGRGNAEPLAVLRSREFLGMFIEELDLMPMLYADDWDPETGTWRPGVEVPDIRDAVRRFRDNLLDVSEDSRTGLVTVSVTWTTPELAALWANELVARLNDRMRQQAQVEAEANVAYLQEQLAGTTLVTLQQSIGRLLETELQKLMLARGNEQFAFRILDHAEEPNRRSSPNRTLLVALATFSAALLALFVILVLFAIDNAKSHQVKSEDM